ncbi:hypothetical protein IEQ34_020475 [Dendrobium chrysotoxum]|uniref:Uncharacterized protein n=1 Tax=Dendrobium chrysotoxum TaxID=161865 RepID=A0AAV7G235_DENCH|nr:hypothetical protein IEQ34_020475 [Dendrobium chrysotoxum]
MAAEDYVRDAELDRQIGGPDVDDVRDEKVGALAAEEVVEGRAEGGDGGEEVVEIGGREVSEIFTIVGLEEVGGGGREREEDKLDWEGPGERGV